MLDLHGKLRCEGDGMRTAIVADTNSGITPEEAAERGITLIPMPFLIDGAEYREGE